MKQSYRDSNMMSPEESVPSLKKNQRNEHIKIIHGLHTISLTAKKKHDYN